MNAVGDPERIQGPYRLVKLARFLLDYYYPVYMRLCHYQGVLLSEYPADQPAPKEVQDLLAALNERSETFSKNFYGYE